MDRVVYYNMVTNEEGFWGFRRRDGRVGVRNHVLVLPGGFIAEEVARLVPGVLTLRTADKGYGRTARDRETIFDVLAGLARNPNVYGAVLVDGLDWGYAELATERLRASIEEAGKPVAVVDPGAAGGTFGALGHAVAAARQLASAAEPGAALSETAGVASDLSDAPDHRHPGALRQPGLCDPHQRIAGARER